MAKTLYYTEHRNKGAKWAHFEVYVIAPGGMGETARLIHVATGKYQPGATAGVRHEVQRAAAFASNLPGGTVEGWEAMEIHPRMS